MIQRTLFRSLQSATRQPLAFTARRAHIPHPISRTPVSPSSTTQRLQSRRSYSQAAESEARKEETLENQAAAQGQAEPPKPSSSSSPADATATELEAKKKENLELTDRLKRQVAEFRNLQEQTKREVQASRDFALQRFAKDLLDSVDNLDRALTNVPADKLTDGGNQDLVNLHSGLKMTEEILMTTLKKHGMERFDPSVTGDKFDPNKMEATFQAPQQGKEDGSVFYTQSKGFTLNGRVLRAAKVGVVRNS